MKRNSSICSSVCGAKSEWPPSDGTTLIAVVIVVPDQNRLAQSGASSDQRRGCRRVHICLRIENAEILRRKMFDAVAGGAEIVEHDYFFNFDGVDERLRNPPSREDSVART